jgi:putative protease
VFSQELPAAAELLLAAEAAGVDAVIVQDIGLAVLAAQLTPALAVHGSTQMSITSAAGVAMAAELGAVRVVLARELGLRDLERLQRQLQQRGLAMPLEVFVHGALCVAYSGQCLTSEALGQRSANRGECAQACRLPYQLVVDGVACDLDDRRYLLSPQDLAAWELLPQLQQAGVASLKIEGRLKDASYVAAVTEAYRRGLDQLALDPADPVRLDDQGRAAVRRQLELSFSRGLGTGWFEGIDHQRLVQGRWSKKRGPLVGRLMQVEPRGVLVLRTDQPLKPGDGVVLELPGRDPLQPPQEVGGRLMRVEHRPRGGIAVTLGPGRIPLEGLAAGAPCWLSSDPQLESHLQRLAEKPTPECSRPLSLRVSGRAGEPLRLAVLQAEGLAAIGPALCVSSDQLLQPARDQGLDAPRLRQQLGRLGGTPWHLGELQLQLEGELFLPLAQLNGLRRRLVDRLAEALEAAGASDAAPGMQGAPSATAPQPATVLEPLLRQARAQASGAPPPATPSLTVLARSLEQLRALRGLAVQRVIVELEQPAELRQAVELGRGHWPGGLWLAGPRICRPDEAWTLEPLLRAAPDGYLVRNADQLERLTPHAPCQGDFSLNVANPLTAHWLLARWGLERLTASYDLALEQLLDLVAGCPPGSLEITLHQHMPLFHMEHCLFCAFLSEGHDHTDCGRPCEQHTVLLRDRSGAEHPLRADLGCRNTLFNGRAQTAAEALPALLAAGVRHLRLELLQESAADVQRRVQLYGQALAGQISGREVWQREQLDNRLGVTRGTLLERR